MDNVAHLVRHATSTLVKPRSLYDVISQRVCTLRVVSEITPAKAHRNDLDLLTVCTLDSHGDPDQSPLPLVLADHLR